MILAITYGLLLGLFLVDPVFFNDCDITKL